MSEPTDTQRPSGSAPAPAPPERATRRRVVLLGLLAGALVLVLIALAVTTFGSEDDETASPGEPEFAAALDVPPGGVASIATVELPNPEGAEVTVEEVTLVNSEGVNFIDGAVVTPADRAQHGTVDYGPQFPPSGWPYDEIRPIYGTVQAEEFAEAPEDDSALQLVVAVYPVREGMVGFNGIEVTYVLDGERRTDVFPHGLVLCSPPSSCDGVEPLEALTELGVVEG